VSERPDDLSVGHGRLQPVLGGRRDGEIESPASSVESSKPAVCTSVRGWASRLRWATAAKFCPGSTQWIRQLWRAKGAVAWPVPQPIATIRLRGAISAGTPRRRRALPGSRPAPRGTGAQPRRRWSATGCVFLPRVLSS
jgi:hypothetical protein